MHALCGAFMAHCTAFHSNQFVWVDKTDSDSRDHIRKYGYSIRGITPVSHRLMVRGTRVNAIAALSAQGILAVDITLGSVNGMTIPGKPNSKYDAFQWFKSQFSSSNGQLLHPSCP